LTVQLGRLPLQPKGDNFSPFDARRLPKWREITSSRPGNLSHSSLTTFI
jgi:hypothetical protein